MTDDELEDYLVNWGDGVEKAEVLKIPYGSPNS